MIDRVFHEILAISPPSTPIAEPAPVAPAPEQITLTKLLANEIANKQLNVTESTQRGIVTIQGQQPH